MAGRRRDDGAGTLTIGRDCRRLDWLAVFLAVRGAGRGAGEGVERPEDGGNGGRPAARGECGNARLAGCLL